MVAILIQMIGSQVACAEGIKDTWREVGDWTKNQLVSQYGSAIDFRYFDLFDPDCPDLPTSAQLPLILVDGEPVINGDKVSIPALRKKIEARAALLNE